jgi:hypothetical protein
MSLEFTPAAIPTVTRTSEPNPFGPLATALAADRKAALSFTLPLSGKPSKGTTVDAVIGKAKRQISEAGATAGITIRSTYALTAPGKGKDDKGTVTFTAWAKEGDRIAKPRKAAK